MPGFDGKGPLGKGPLSGRGMGYCVIELNSSDAKNKKVQEEEVVEMPRGDGTGPMGLGSMTGRAAGYCAGYAAPGYANPLPGRGYLGRAMGPSGRGGRGWRNWYYATGLSGWQRASMAMPAFGGGYSSSPEMTPRQEADILKNEADILKKQLEDIQNRIEILEKAQEAKNG